MRERVDRLIDELITVVSDLQGAAMLGEAFFSRVAQLDQVKKAQVFGFVKGLVTRFFAGGGR